jgi:hypothetical protein
VPPQLTARTTTNEDIVFRIIFVSAPSLFAPVLHREGIRSHCGGGPFGALVAAGFFSYEPRQTKTKLASLEACAGANRRLRTFLQDDRRVAREPRQKGTSLLPVIAALKAHPDRLRLVPERLWGYFDDHIVVSGWYPERDYFVLIEALVKTIDPKTVGGDVWRYFARYSVRRDLGGTDAAGGSKSSTKGIYRTLASVTADEPEQFFRRAAKLWSQYHDTGTMQILGGRVTTNSVFFRLVGFHIPLQGFVQLQGYYLEEFGRMIGLELESSVTRSTARGEPFCEWEYRLAPTPASEGYVASLPALPGLP